MGWLGTMSGLMRTMVPLVQVAFMSMAGMLPSVSAVGIMPSSTRLGGLLSNHLSSFQASPAVTKETVDLLLTLLKARNILSLAFSCVVKLSVVYGLTWASRSEMGSGV